MPEPNILSFYSFTSEPPKKAPVIKLSCGIGDTDGFPAFDVDSEQYAAKDDSKWGFLITGGAEFHMPLTVFQVTPDGLADKGGICLGDIILEINEEDATNLTLTQAHEKIDASAKKIHFLVKSMEEEPMEGYEPGEERSIVLRVPKPPPPPKVSTIEKRLQELQRKLSEIAEIPKILSSTLATVSETFDKLTTSVPPSTIAAPQCRHHPHNGNDYCTHFYGNEQKRKLSYDEDVYDYELSDEADGGEDEAEEFDAKEAYRQLKCYAARQRRSKEETPESDYASESNYQQNQNANKDQDDVDDDEDEDDEVEYNDINNDDYYCDGNTTANTSITNHDDDDDEKNCDMYEEFNMSVLKIPSGHASSESDTEEFEEGVDDNDNEDFLTTTFTWSLRNKPKLQINDTDDDDNNDNVNKRNNDKDTDKQQKSLNDSKDTLSQECHTKAVTPEKEQKLDKLERSWPWADREKIIYKQSTCHLVPQKPLGLIEQRIQLLAKRNLLEHINKNKNP